MLSVLFPFMQFVFFPQKIILLLYILIAWTNISHSPVLKPWDYYKWTVLKVNINKYFICIHLLIFYFCFIYLFFIDFFYFFKFLGCEAREGAGHFKRVHWSSENWDYKSGTGHQITGIAFCWEIGSLTLIQGTPTFLVGHGMHSVRCRWDLLLTDKLRWWKGVYRS